MDPPSSEVSCDDSGSLVFAVRDALSEAPVRPGSVVVHLVLGQHARRCGSPVIRTRSRSSRRKVPMMRSQVAFVLGALRRCQDHGAGGLKTASKEEVNFDPRSRIRNRKSSNRSPRPMQVAGLLHGPLAVRVGGDAAQMHPAGVMLDDHQDIQPFQQHRINVQEVHREYAAGLRGQELPPRRPGAPGRGIDPGVMENLIDSTGRRQFPASPFTVDAVRSNLDCVADLLSHLRPGGGDGWLAGCRSRSST